MRSLVVATGISLVTAQSNGVFNPLNYGAIGDGVADDTIALRKTTAALELAGGGTLLLPAGYTFFSGPINLTSNTLFVIQGTFLASNNSADYPLIAPLPWFGGGQDAPMSGQPEWHPCIMAWQQSNITIAGGGLIDGNGQAWWDCFESKPPLGPAPCNGYSRPQLLRPVHVVGFELHDITIKHSPAWNIHLANVTGANLYNFSVYAPAIQGNTDGVDIDCSRNVTVSDFYYQGGDDAIAVKAGEDWLGYTYGTPTTDVLVQRMRIASGNGFAVGSEMSAGVKRVRFQDIVVNCTAAAGGTECKHGLYIKTCRGRGGTVEDVVVDNAQIAGVGFAFGFTLDYTRPTPPPTNSTATPHIMNVTMSNSYVEDTGIGFEFEGLSDSIITGVLVQNVTLGKSVDPSTQCDYINGTCVDQADGTCPKCFTG